MQHSNFLRAAIAAGLAACGSSEQVLPAPAPPAEITVAVTSPAPGAELVGSEHKTIVVSGTVATSDPSQGALEAWVNGVRVEVTDGAFRTELTPEPGINHIKVEGGDGIADLVGRELDVLWAPAFLAPLPGATGFDVPGALELRLGQRFFDARLPGSMLDLTTAPVVARDVASAVELILWQLDLKSLVSGTFRLGEGNASLEVTIQAVTPRDIVADARIIDGSQPAIELTIDLLGVALTVNGTFRLGTRVLTVSGSLAADLHASARLTFGTSEGGSIEVSVGNVTATTGQLASDFLPPDGDELDALLLIAGSEFRRVVEGLLGTELIPAFTVRLPPLLEQVLGAADQLLDNISFTLDPGLGSPVTLELDGRIGALDIAAGATTGHVTVRQDLAIRTSGSPIHAASLGAARLSVTGQPVLNNAGIHLMMRQDFLNALLHAVWNAGILEGDVATGGLSAKLSARLPPVVRPAPPSSLCRIDGERCDIQVQLGQIEAQLLGQTFGLNATAGARIEVSGGTVALKIQMVPELQVWSTTPGSLTPDTVSTLITSLVWPQLFGAIGDNLKIQLPLPDLAALGLGDLAPGLADAQLLLQMRQRPSMAGGRLTLGADLELTTPPPP